MQRFVEEVFHEVAAASTPQHLALTAGSRNFTEVPFLWRSPAAAHPELPAHVAPVSAHPATAAVEQHCAAGLAAMRHAATVEVCCVQADYEMLSALDNGVRRRVAPVSEADIAALPTHQHRPAKKVWLCLEQGSWLGCIQMLHGGCSPALSLMQASVSLRVGA
jgi:hypothetical protein